MLDHIGLVPYAEIDTVFLDVGNTLISIDFDRVAEELVARQLHCEPGALRRAEAAARPAYSEQVFVTGVRRDRSLFHSYLCAIFGQAPNHGRGVVGWGDHASTQ